MPYEWLPFALNIIMGNKIEPFEVLQVLGGERRLPRPMVSPAGVSALMIFGRTRGGRPLVVVVPLTRRERIAEIVGAREMTDDERKEFEAWESGR